MKPHLEPLPSWEYYTIVCAIIILVLIGGLVAGLTIGLLSLDETNLQILKVSGTLQERGYATKIEPIRKNGHLLLVTLLLVNTVVNETLPILFDAIHFDGVKAVLISTCLIVIFGEIIPQAVCSKYGLLIGAFFAIPVRMLIYLFYFISYPIACLLDWLLGHKSGMLYRHAGLKELVALHGESQSGPLSKDEVETLQAVLDLKSKTVCDIMTKIDDVFMLPAASNLNRKTINTILDRGHSRIPIYLQDRQHIIGTLLVKQLLLNDPSHETPIASLKLRKLPKVPYDTPLYEMLHIFEAGSSHMALVVKDADSVSSTAAGDVFITRSPNWSIRKQQTETRKFQPIGIVTLEDVIEEFLGTEIIDETDEFVDVNTKVRVSRESLETVGEEEIPETRPFLSRKPVPSSALYFRKINLPKSSLLPTSPTASATKKKKGRKELFSASELVESLLQHKSRLTVKDLEAFKAKSNIGDEPQHSKHSYLNLSSSI